MAYSCTLCDKRFSFKCTLKEHTAWHNGIYKCDECGKHCQSKYILKLHQRKHSDAILYTCQLCLKGFKHKKSHMNHVCVPITGDQADNGGNSKDHIDKPFVCAVCGMSYSRRSGLSNHERRKHGTTPRKCFPCAECDKSFLGRKSLENHTITAHSVNGLPRPFLCTACGKTFTDKQSLKVHALAAHSAIKPFQCPTCQQRFGSRSCLRMHITGKHTDHKPHLCTFCGKRCITKQTLTNHLRVHTKEKPFKCTYCNVRSAYKSRLKNHERIHTGETPYHCDQCQGMFRTAELLNLHKKVEHTKDNPNVCHICGDRCATAANLRMHVNNHTRPFICPTCGRGFASNWKCKDHEKRHNKLKIRALIDSTETEEKNDEVGDTKKVNSEVLGDTKKGKQKKKRKKGKVKESKLSAVVEKEKQHVAVKVEQLMFPWSWNQITTERTEQKDTDCEKITPSELLADMQR